MKSLKSFFRRPAPPQSQPQQAGGKSGSRTGAAPQPPGRDLGSASSLESKPAKRSKKLFPSPKAQRKKPSVQGSQDSLCAAGSSESMLSVHEELQVTKKEKSLLEKRVKQMQQEYHQEVAQLRTELVSLQERSTEMDQANTALRARLHNVAHSPLSDTEKQQLLLQHNAANPISTSPDVFSPSGEMEVSCTTPDWDNKSGSSEVSVACLQDRIMQMEETHYSTNEELQATLQELADLQTQLTELQSDNERLLDEKNVLLESLCRQTEKLEDSRTKVDTLQELLLREGGQGEVVCTEREQKLVDLLKSSQEERETLLSKQDELNSQLASLRDTSSTQENEVARLRDRVALLESAVDAAHEERSGLDRELACAKQDSSSRQIEISRLATLLENARAKIEELEATRELGDKTEMDEILDAVRKEKDQLESQVASLQEQLSRSQVQATRLREQSQHLQEECKVTRNNAKSQVSDLEYERDNLKQEMKELSADLQSLKETASDLQMQCQCHLEDKRQLKSLLSERQRDLAERERKMQEQGEELVEEKKLRQEETVEWSKFQSDLLMAVRVANDFKTEAQHELEKLVLENKALRDKNRALDTQLDRQKAQNKPPEPPAVRAPSVTETNVLTSVQQELQVRRQKTGISRQDSRLSVKSLIDSIENATKQAKNSPGSRSSSTSSLSSIASGAAIANTVTPQSPTSDMVPLREQQNKRNILADNTLVKSDMKRDDDGSNSISIFNKNLDFGRRNSQPDISERKDPLAYLVKNGGSKRNALLKWCQNKTVGYRNIDITNFSSSWNDGLALCAILHTYLPDRVPYDTLTPNEKRRNFTLAFAAAESVGVPTTLNLNDMIQLERPDWQQVIAYITALYRHFET